MRAGPTTTDLHANVGRLRGDHGETRELITRRLESARVRDIAAPGKVPGVFIPPGSGPRVVVPRHMASAPSSPLWRQDSVRVSVRDLLTWVIVDSRELLEILTSARNLLSDASRWSADHIAADVNGRWVPVGSDGARRFNLQGAVIRAAGYRARDAMKAAENTLGSVSSTAFARVLTSPQVMTHSEALAWLYSSIFRLPP